VTGDRFGLGLALLGALALPSALGDSVLSAYVLLVLTAIVTVGVSMLMGYAGQVSLGQAAFYAFGAYAAGLLSVHACPTLLALAVAPLTSAALAALVGVPLLRLRGHYLSFATLAVQLIGLSVIGGMKSLTGGDIGLGGIPRLGLLGWELTSDPAYARLAGVALLGVVVVTRNLIASRPGRALRALSTSEVAAESCGIPVGRYKLAVFALSAGFAGLAGGIYTFYVGYLSPGSFPVVLSFEYVVMAVLGGLGTVSGGVIGAAAVTLVVQILSKLATAGGMPSYAPVVLSYGAYALLLIIPVLFLPQGIVPALAAPIRAAVARAARRWSPRT